MNKKTNKFEYPHPLIKNLSSSRQFNEQNYKDLLKQKPAMYDTNYTFSSSIKDMISPKLLRLSNTKVIPQQRFGILMQPFNSRQQVEQVSMSQKDTEQIKCKICKSFFNSQCQSISFNQIKCRICGDIKQSSVEVKNSLQNIPRCWDFVQQKQQALSQTTLQKNICFVIEASQFNYNYKIHEVIQSCLQSLKSTLNTSSSDSQCEYQNQHQFQIERKLSQKTIDDDQAIFQSNKQIICAQVSGQTERQINNFKQKSNSVSYNVGFILFNDERLFIVNQENGDITNFSKEFLTLNEDNTQNYQNYNNKSHRNTIIKFKQFFKPINQITQQTYQIVQEILYDSYLKNTSCLDFVTQFISNLFDRFQQNNFSSTNKENSLNQNSKSKEPKYKQVEYKFFINSLRFTKNNRIDDANFQVNNNQRQAKIFFNITNTISSKISQSFSKNAQKNIKLSSENMGQAQVPLIKSNLCLNHNFEFFYLPQFNTSSCQLSQKEIIKKLNNNLFKMYYKASDKSLLTPQQLFNQMYYDLYQNLTVNQKYFNVKVKIITSEKVDILAVGNSSIEYADFSQGLKKVQSSLQTGMKFNQYSITLKCFQPTTTLPIDLKICQSNTQLKTSKSISQSKHFIQISLSYFKQHSSHFSSFARIFQTQVITLNRPINYHHHIYSSLSTYVDDQTLFYFNLRETYADCQKSKTNHTIYKKLYEKVQQIANHFKDQYGKIDFHKEYVRIFLYSFMVMGRPLTAGNDQNFYYQRHIMMKNSMENISKAIYPRTYQLIRNKQNKKVQLKNVKSSPKNFKTDSLLLLDNGKNLYMIIGQDNSVQDLKVIFGTCFIHQIRQITDLPQLEGNQCYRDAIQQARLNHESNYLPLRIIQLFSPQFDKQISHTLYIKDNHYKFMRQLWEMEPIKNVRNKK